MIIKIKTICIQKKKDDNNDIPVKRNNNNNNNDKFIDHILDDQS